MDFNWIAERDLNEASIAPYLPKGTEYRIVGPADDDLRRVDQKLKDLGFKPIQQGFLEDTIPQGGQITFAAEMTFDMIVQRAIAKIAFNYAAYVLGADFVRNSSFDPTRRFIRYNQASGYQVTTPTFRPILADDEPLKRQTNGHLLIVEWGDRLQSFLRARVSLFNEMTYVVRLCGRYTGLWIDVATGHLFDPQGKSAEPATEASATQARVTVGLPRWRIALQPCPRFECGDLRHLGLLTSTSL